MSSRSSKTVPTLKWWELRLVKVMWLAQSPIRREAKWAKTESSWHLVHILMADMPWCLSKGSMETKDLQGVLPQAVHLELSWDVLSLRPPPSAPPTILSVYGQTLTMGLLSDDLCGQKERYSLKQCKAISLEASVKGELLLIGGKDSNRAQHNCLWGFGFWFYFHSFLFSSSSSEGHVLLLPSVQDAFEYEW